MTIILIKKIMLTKLNNNYIWGFYQEVFNVKKKYMYRLIFFFDIIIIHFRSSIFPLALLVLFFVPLPCIFATFHFILFFHLAFL